MVPKVAKRNKSKQIPEPVPVPKQGVLVQATKGLLVPVQANRMQPVPVQVKGVPVQVCLKCQDCVVFVYLSSNSYTISMGTSLND